MSAWTVYLVRCRDGSLYVGITNDLPKRVRAHNAGRGGRYTRSRRPVALAFKRRCASSTNARRWERALKQLDRARKLLLVAGDRSVLRAARARVTGWEEEARETDRE